MKITFKPKHKIIGAFVELIDVYVEMSIYIDITENDDEEGVEDLVKTLEIGIGLESGESISATFYKHEAEVLLESLAGLIKKL